jgi:hypothetical protein
MATYDNDLRLKEIATGDESGTWGTSTNTNLELISDAFGYGTKAMAADSDETFTIPDFSADATRGMFLKITSGVSLTATRVITLGPNTVSKIWIIDNATTGGQIITIKQGSGATVNVPNGSKVMVVTDGAGAGAAVLNANPTEIGGTVTSVGGTGTVNGITLTGTVTSSGNLTLGGTLDDIDLTSGVTGTLPIANGGTGSTSTTFADLTTNVTGTLPVANGGTGATTLTANNVLLGNGTSAPQAVAPGTSGNVLTSDGTTWASTAPAGGGFTSTALVALSGLSSTTFSGIPSGVSKIFIQVKQCRQSGSITIEIGDSGGIETSGYISSSCRITDATGANSVSSSGSAFLVRGGLAANDEYNGIIILSLLDSATNHWVESHTLSSDWTPNFVFGGGQKSLSGELTQLRFGGSVYNSAAAVSISYI